MRILARRLGKQRPERLAGRGMNRPHILEYDEFLSDAVHHGRGRPVVAVKVPMGSRGGLADDERAKRLLYAFRGRERVLRKAWFACGAGNVSVHGVVVDRVDWQEHVEHFVPCRQWIGQDQVVGHERHE